MNSSKSLSEVYFKKYSGTYWLLEPTSNKNRVKEYVPLNVTFSWRILLYKAYISYIFFIAAYIVAYSHLFHDLVVNT